MLKRAFAGFILFIVCNNLLSQINVVNTMFNAFNVTPNALIYANIMNMGEETEVFAEASLYNSQNQVINHVISSSFTLRKGINNTAQFGISVKSSEYSNGNDAQFIKTNHQLPSGKFKYCITIKSVSNSIEGDELCDEFENESNSFLFLTSPFDKDTIESNTPLLIWNHSDPFTLMQQGETYRMLVVELKNDQTADAGVNINSPILQNNFLTRHDIQYPFDAPKLESGKRYGWQVQKIINNIIVNKTEAWEFVLKPENKENYDKYIELKPNYGSGIYEIHGSKLYFTFNQEYYSHSNQLSVSIIPENQNPLNNPKLKEDKSTGSPKINYKTLGDNKYEIDLNALKINEGYYYLNIIDEKKQEFKLKFHVK